MYDAQGIKPYRKKNYLVNLIFLKKKDACSIKMFAN